MATKTESEKISKSSLKLAGRIFSVKTLVNPLIVFEFKIIRKVRLRLEKFLGFEYNLFESHKT